MKHADPTGTYSATLYIGEVERSFWKDDVYCNHGRDVKRCHCHSGRFARAAFSTALAGRVSRLNGHQFTELYSEQRARSNIVT